MGLNLIMNGNSFYWMMSPRDCWTKHTEEDCLEFICLKHLFEYLLLIH